jgi:hypothetical protein
MPPSCQPLPMYIHTELMKIRQNYIVYLNDFVYFFTFLTVSPVIFSLQSFIWIKSRVPDPDDFCPDPQLF